MKIGTKRKRYASNENLNLYELEQDSFSSSNTSLISLNLHDINQEINESYASGHGSWCKKSKLNKSFEFDSNLKHKKLHDISNSTSSGSNTIASLNLNFNFNSKHQQQKSNLNLSNIVAAKTSSYFSLTPASSTTSLNDLNDHEPFTSSLNKEFKVLSSTNQPPSTSLSSATKTSSKAKARVKTVRKKRGRPAKSINNNNNKNSTEKIDKYVITEKENNEETTKPRLSSNLQKSKVLFEKNSFQQEEETCLEKETNPLDNLHEFYANYNKIKSKTESFCTQTPLPELTWANSSDLWNAMRQSDLKYKHNPGYTRNHVGIEPQMRAILLDWLAEISYAYRLHRETFHLAVEYMDRFMSVSKQQMRVDRLQLIGLTSLYLAAKVEEIYPPKLADFASHMESYCSNNEEAMAKFELFMLKTLNWQISPVTVNTWLQSYLQIASLNYPSLIEQFDLPDEKIKLDDLNENKKIVYSTNLLLPLHLYKNSEAKQGNSKFYLKNYMKCMSLIDLAMFDMEVLKFDYSVIAAAAMYHMLSSNEENSSNRNRLAACLVEKSTGFRLFELDSCIKWLYPYADVCNEILTDELMTYIKPFSNVDPDDCHNIQVYHQNLDLLKEAQTRRTPMKFYANSLLLTPPESHRKYACSSSASSSFSSSASTTPQTRI